MDMKKIGQIIEERRVLTEFSSYPMIVEFNDTKHIIWFNYMMSESESDIQVVVTEGFCVNEQYEIEKKRFDFREIYSDENMEEPEIEYIEYLEKLDELYREFNAEAMKELMLKTEVSYMLKIYDDVKLCFLNK